MNVNGSRLEGFIGGFGCRLAGVLHDSEETIVSWLREVRPGLLVHGCRNPSSKSGSVVFDRGQEKCVQPNSKIDPRVRTP
ncbi:hypothetical protein NL676_039576 [Syzygium grande]|nr:hypothetical protein NL676_039576 [Syzygium grande]